MSVSKRKEKTPILMNKLLCLGLPILELSKMTFMSFGMIMGNQKIGEKQNCVIWI